MKKVLFILPAIYDGGAERVMTLLSSKAVDNGYDVYFCLAYENIISYKLRNEIKLIINEGSTSAIGQIKFIRSIIKKYKIDKCVSFIPHQNLFTLIAAMHTKAKVVLSVRNDPITEFNKKWKDILSKLLYKKAQNIVFQTPDAKGCYGEKIQKLGIVIPNPITKNLPSWQGIESNEFMTAARLTKQKNLFLMIDAFIQFHNKYPEYILSIYGDGDEKDKLSEYINTYKAQEYINLKGRESNIFDKMKNSFAFILSSDFEGMSNSMLEAMAIGMPSACTDCRIGAPKMFINHGVNGFLSPIKDVEALANNLSSIVEAKKSGNIESISNEAKKIRLLLDEDEIYKKWFEII